jgi:putative ABC transport system permease protein
MTRLRLFLFRLWSLIRSRQMDRDIDDEIASHLAEATDEYTQQGLSPEDAQRAALRSFGGVTQTKELYRQVRSFTWLDDLRQDVPYAIRGLRRSPGFTTVACVTLALGIGANTAIFSIVNSLLLRPLPVPEPDRLVTISSATAVSFGFTAGAGWNYPMWNRLRQRAEAFDGALAFTAERFNLAPGGERQPVDGLYVSGEFFTTVSVPALLGRTFTPADDVRGGGPDGPVAVISYRLWQRRFGGAASVIGTPVAVDGVPFTIIGVTPPEFLHVEVGRTFDVAVPLATQPLIRGKDAAIDQPRALILIVMLRLKPEQSLEAATATLRAMQPDILGVTPDELARVRPPNLAEPFTLVPASAGTSGAAGPGLRQQYERPLLAILIIVALVLLIACANLANLLLARATGRRHELSVRRALGASRWRLARQWLVESFVLAVLGAAVGLAVAAWGSRMLVAQLSTAESPVTLDLSFDWVVLAYTTAVTVATVMFFGTVPALRATRVAPIDALKAHGVNAGPGGGGLAHSKLANGGSSSLVIAQVAFSLVVMAAAGLFIRTFDQLASVPLGFDPDRVLVIDVDTARARVDPAARFAYYDRLAGAVVSVPGVTHAAASIWTPLSGDGYMRDAQGRAVFSERVGTNFVTPTWFDVYGIGIRAGRDFDHRDAANTLPVAIVNETFVRKFLAGRHAIGETVQGRDGTRRTVVGVVTDTVFGRSLRDTAPSMMYVPLAQAAGLEGLADTGIRISVRSTSEQPGSVALSMGTALTAVNRDLAFSFRPLADDVDAALARERLVAMLSGFFGALAVFLAAIGLYGVTACTAAQRRTEIAIRMSLGAQRSEVIGLVLRRGLGLTAIGIALGLATAAAVTRYLEALLFGVTPVDPATFFGVSFIFVAVAAVASGMPARRASNVDPMVALRAE